ncbi:hypothetical protein DL770_010693 [Monosporascus sp. CRB-9-2]|nr:hypothetical protein DL770_010693 [Monosporascus sp. CRB-9-2]
MEYQETDLPDCVDSQEECAPSSRSCNSPGPSSYPEQLQTWAEESPEDNADTSKKPEDPVATVDEISYSWPYHPYINVEDIGQYRIGGLHPVRLGDFLGDDDRFRVVHKLGYGHFSTVWLCFDHQEKLWRGIKVLCAEESLEDNPELRAMRYFEGFSAEYMSDNHVGLPLEHFWINGPNGRHLCLVLPLLGPRIQGFDKWDYDDQLWFLNDQIPDIYTNVAFQVTRGLSVLHRRGLCHGDLRPANILLQYDRKAYQLSEAEIMGILHKPEDYAVRLSPGKLLPPGVPPYLVTPADQSGLRHMLSGNISIVDFGLSYPVPGEGNFLSKPEIGMPCQYAAPEVLFFGPKASAGIPTDMWALACTICDLECTPMLFGTYVQTVFRALETLLGPLPEPYRTAWLENYSEIVGRWGVAWDYEADMKMGWEQRFEDEGYDVGPVTMSRERFDELRRGRIADSGFEDAFEGTVGHEHCEQVVASEAPDSLGDLPSEDEKGRKLSEPSNSDFAAQSPRAGDSQCQADGVDESSSRPEADRTARTVAVSEEMEEGQSIYLSQHENHPPRRDERHERAPPIITRAQYEAVRRQYGLLDNMPHRHGDDNPADDSHSECPTDEDSLLDVCEPTRPHPDDVRAANPRPPPPHLGPGETLKFYTDESGTRYKLWRMPTDRVVMLADLLRRMLRYDPKDRIDTTAVLKHPWFGERWRALHDIEADGSSAVDFEDASRATGGRRRKSTLRQRRATTAEKPLRRSARLANKRAAARDPAKSP